MNLPSTDAPRTRSSYVARVRAVLSHPRSTWGAAALAVLLLVPTFRLGFQADDYTIGHIVRGDSGMPLPKSAAFSAVDGDPARAAALADLGILPWWSAPDLRLAFFRPLAVATHAFDFTLWPKNPVPMHLHSLLWLAATVFAAGAAYQGLSRRSPFPFWAGGLATLLFALDEAHAIPAGWIANRNAEIATALGLAALAAHLRWRQEGRTRFAVMSALLLAGALAAGEMGLGAVAFLVSAAWVFEKGIVQKLAALAPTAIVSAIWLGIYGLGHYGAHGSGLYIDPGSEPLRFLAALAQRGPILVLGAWTPLFSDASNVLTPEQAWGLAGLGALVLVLLAALFLPLLRRDPNARFFALGALLAGVPAAATNPSNRLLVVVGFGVAGLLALLAVERFTTATTAPRRRTLLWAVPILGFFHLIVAPLMTPWYAASIAQLGEPAARSARALPAQIEGRDLYALNPPDYLLNVSFALPIRATEGLANPRRFRGLAAGPIAFEGVRTDERTLELFADSEVDHGFLSGPLGHLFRSEDRSARVGELIAMPGFEATVLEVTAQGAPRRVAFRFDLPLDDPSLAFVTWRGERPTLWRPTAIGQRFTLEPSRGGFEALAAGGAEHDQP